MVVIKIILCIIFFIIAIVTTEDMLFDLLEIGQFFTFSVITHFICLFLAISLLFNLINILIHWT